MSEKGYKVIKVDLNRSGIKQILQSDGMMAALKGHVQTVGKGVEETSFVGFDRAHVLVEADKNAD